VLVDGSHSPARTTLHDEARALMVHVTACQMAHLGGCLGPLDVAHVDGNEANNTPGNLAKWCRAHHMLWDRRRITRQALRMPAYWTRGDGKRVYLHPAPGQLTLI
jgi:hypothetical protein